MLNIIIGSILVIVGLIISILRIIHYKRCCNFGEARDIVESIGFIILILSFIGMGVWVILGEILC